MDIARHILHNHIKLYYFCLNPASPITKAVLRVLTAMVTQETAAAREVQGVFDFSLRALSALTHHHDNKVSFKRKYWDQISGYLKKALSINALHACVYIYIWQLRCFRACTLWFTDLTVAAYVIFNTLFWVYVNFVHKKKDKTQKYLKCTVFVWYDNDCERWLGTQSITTERVSLRIVSIEWLVRILICYHCSLGSGFLVINLVLWVVRVFLCFPPSIFGWEHLLD